MLHHLEALLRSPLCGLRDCTSGTLVRIVLQPGYALVLLYGHAVQSSDAAAKLAHGLQNAWRAGVCECSETCRTFSWTRFTI